MNLFRRSAPAVPGENDMMSILVVEDNENMRLLLGTILEARGYRVTMCPNGQAAEDTSRRTPFDVVLVDYYMPGRNGLEVARIVREHNPRTCIIGMSLEDRKDDFLSIGANAFLPKPFDIADLMKVIDTAV